MIYINYYFSVTVWQLFNPFGFYQSLLQNFGQIFSILRQLFSKSSVRYVPVSLPFEEQWLVFNGGTDKRHSHSWNVISQRYAYDFVKSGGNNKRFNSEGKTASDYFAFDKNVIAPADGVVVAVKNNIRDYKYAGSGKIDILTPDVRGNFIIIKHDDNVYSLTAHLKKKSCQVKKGDPVKRGQIIAKCGNSGHSAEPHIHFQLQDKPNWYFALGLPIMFSNIVKNNSGTVEEAPAYIARADIVANTICQEYFSEKITLDQRLSSDMLNPLVWSIINVLGIVVGGGFFYYTIINLLISIVSSLPGYF